MTVNGEKKLIDISIVPSKPGCYLFFDNKGKAIYVGKARNLKNRIKAYLQASDSRYHIRFLLQKAVKIDYIVTENEKEALLLENNLIKEHKPKYNIRLKDDKNFLSLRLDPKEKFPRLTFVRKPKKDGALYFGPYQVASAIRDTYRQLHNIVPLRRCSDNTLSNRTRPCIYYEIGTCLAPCVGKISEKEYADLVQQAIFVLQGKADVLEKELLEQIEREVSNLNFERAAQLRDRLYALKKIMEPQKSVLAHSHNSIDAWGIYKSEKIIFIHILFYRGGKLTGSYSISLESPIDSPIEETIGNIILNAYLQMFSPPTEILISLDIEEIKALEQVLTENFGRKIKINSPKKGIKRDILELALKNAEAKYIEELKIQSSKALILQEIQRIFSLPKLPLRIECFDASTLQGNQTVVGMVTYENASPKKMHYRRFEISTEKVHDDYFAIRDALIRRFTHLTDLPLPDLLMIDGGKGHLNVALAVLSELNLNHIPCVSIAKTHSNSRAKSTLKQTDRFFIPNRVNPIIIKPYHSPALLLMQQIRDEAHRFAIKYHRTKKINKAFEISFSIPGVGKLKIQRLLNHFKSIDKIKSATVNELMQIKGISEKTAKIIYNYFRENI
ncbi:MAG: excinuclease ABC subunit UvrC [Candidatus Hydrogenedentes bacterium]|nr:excinuclease ABC subunit UvrC [Candidatus Hydrogenedentota bacterium]